MLPSACFASNITHEKESATCLQGDMAASSEHAEVNQALLQNENKKRSSQAGFCAVARFAEGPTPLCAAQSGSSGKATAPPGTFPAWLITHTRALACAGAMERSLNSANPPPLPPRGPWRDALHCALSVRAALEHVRRRRPPVCKAVEAQPECRCCAATRLLV